MKTSDVIAKLEESGKQYSVDTQREMGSNMILLKFEIEDQNDIKLLTSLLPLECDDKPNYCEVVFTLRN